MRVDPEEQWTVDGLSFSIPANRFSNREYVPFVEPARERRTPVARGAEAYTVRSNRWIGALGVVRRDQARDIDQAERIGGFPASGLTPACDTDRSAFGVLPLIEQYDARQGTRTRFRHTC